MLIQFFIEYQNYNIYKMLNHLLKNKNSRFGNINKAQKRSDSNALLQVLNCPDNNIISNIKTIIQQPS